MRYVMSALIALVVSGCGGAIPQAELTASTGRIERGPQGGVHLLVDFTCRGCPREVTLSYGVTSSEGMPLTFEATRRLRLPAEDEARFGPLIALFSLDEATLAEASTDLWLWGTLEAEGYEPQPLGSSVSVVGPD